MDKILNFVKNNKIKILTVIFIVFIIVLTFSKKENKVTTPTPTPIGIVEYKGLIPGSSTKDEVVKELGTALNAKIEDSKETYEYKSSNRNFNSEVVIIDNKLSYLKLIYTISDNIKYVDFINKYGEPEKILYGPDYSVGYVLNTYPSKGIAFLSHLKSSNVREVWYFIPTTIEDFTKTYTPSYSERAEIVQ